MINVGDEVRSLKWPYMAGTVTGIGSRCDWIVKWSPVTFAQAKKMHFDAEIFDQATTVGWAFEAWERNIEPLLSDERSVASIIDEDFSAIFTEEVT